MKEKNEKKCSLLFSFYDRTRIVDYLEKQAEEGWLFDKLTSLGGWHFHRIEPKKVRFSVVYLKNESMFDPYGTPSQMALSDFCKHEGWTFVASNAQMQIFYTEDTDASPIVTDASVEIKSIHATMKKTYLPTYVIWILLAFVNISLKLWNYWLNPVKWLSSNTSFFVIGCWLLIALAYGANLIEYTSWYCRAKKAASLDGSFIRTKGLNFISLCSALLASLSLVLSVVFLIGNRGVAIGICAVLLIVFGVFAIMMLSDLFRRLKYSRRINRFLTVGMLILLTVGIIVGILALAFKEAWSDKDEENTEIYVSEASGYKQTIYHDELPLTVADLTGTDYERDSKKISLRGSSLFAYCLEACEDSRWDDPEQPELRYTVVAFRTPIGYSTCRALMLRDFTYDDPDYSAVKTDATPWGADEAYQLTCGSEERPRLAYLLFYGNTIVEIHFNYGWEEAPTDVQKAIVGEKLGKYTPKK